MEKKGIPRLYYLDWLRVLAILSVFVFHCGRFFDLEEWHVKNPTTYFGANVWTYFLAFLPRYFHGFRDFGGNFAWTGIHLWYLLALFVLTLVFLPLFVWLKTGYGKRLLSWLAGLLAKPGVVYLLAVPGTLLIRSLDPNQFLTSRDWGGWALPLYIPFFLAGFLIVSHDGLQTAIRRQRWLSLVAGVAFFVAALVVVLTLGDPDFGTPIYPLFWSLFSLYSWCSVLAILGFGMQHLTADTPFLRYTNEAVLPFYILHQTVIISIGFFVVRWPIPDLVKFAVIAISSFVLIMLLYEFLVRRFNFMRFLFGMKLRPKAPAAEAQQAAATGVMPR